MSESLRTAETNFSNDQVGLAPSLLDSVRTRGGYLNFRHRHSVSCSVGQPLREQRRVPFFSVIPRPISNIGETLAME